MKRKSNYRGVSRHKLRWSAEYTLKGKRILRRLYADESEAARAVDAAIIEHEGPRGLNFPEEFAGDRSRIPLGNGKCALIDPEDFDEIARYKWRFSNGYAVRAGARMHQQLMGFPDSTVDHKNRNPLDNRRSNLRLADESQQAKNRGPHSRNTLGLKGVYPCGRKYAARIGKNGQQHLGMFDNPFTAAFAYDAAAVKDDPEFAAPNFVREGNVRRAQFPDHLRKKILAGIDSLLELDPGTIFKCQDGKWEYELILKRYKDK